MSEWWTVQDAAMIGAIGGSAVGVLGGVFGTAIGVCAPRGIARGPVLGAQGVIIAVGALALIAGAFGALAGQPHHVSFPLLLCGFLMTTIFGGLMPVTLARYRQVEARKLEAEELRRG